MGAGVAFLAGALGVAWIDHGVAHYLVALALLGVGWNFLFTAGSTLITTTYHHTERFKAQGLNDLIVFGTMALLTLAAGVLLDLAGWRGLLLCALPFLALMLALLLLAPRKPADRRTGPLRGLRRAGRRCAREPASMFSTLFA